MEEYQDYLAFYDAEVVRRGLNPEENPTAPLGSNGFRHKACALFRWKGHVCEVMQDAKLGALDLAFLKYRESGEDAFVVEDVETKQALRIIETQRAEGFYVYLKKNNF